MSVTWRELGSAARRHGLMVALAVVAGAVITSLSLATAEAKREVEAVVAVATPAQTSPDAAVERAYGLAEATAPPGDTSIGTVTNAPTLALRVRAPSREVARRRAAAWRQELVARAPAGLLVARGPPRARPAGDGPGAVLGTVAGGAIGLVAGLVAAVALTRRRERR